jgi:hypothetical protein
MEEPVLGPDGAPQIDPMSGTMMMKTVSHRVMEEFDFSILKKLWLNISIDAGATTYYSEIAMVQTLDNLRRDGTLDIISYLERIPEKLIPRKAELIEDLKNRALEQQAQGMPDPNMPPPGGEKNAPSASRIGSIPSGSLPAMGGRLDTDKAVSTMPHSIQAKFNNLPRSAQKALVQQSSLL